MAKSKKLRRAILKSLRRNDGVFHPAGGDIIRQLMIQAPYNGSTRRAFREELDTLCESGELIPIRTDGRVTGYELAKER